MDEDSPDNLPSGVASLARNCDYTYTSVKTRNGINRTMQGVNQSPITGLFGLVYTPQSDAAADVMFQLAHVLRQGGTLQYESPLGTGRMEPLPADLFSLPRPMRMPWVRRPTTGSMHRSRI